MDLTFQDDKGRTVAIVTVQQDYYYGDPQPPRSAGYGAFVEWQEAQFRKRRRPADKKQRGGKR